MTSLQWSGRTEQLHQQLNWDIVKIIFKLVWNWMETKKFKQQFITFLVAIRSKCAFDIDWPVPNKTYWKKSQFWRILDLLGSSWPLETWHWHYPAVVRTWLTACSSFRRQWVFHDSFALRSNILHEITISINVVESAWDIV